MRCSLPTLLLVHAHFSVASASSQHTFGDSGPFVFPVAPLPPRAPTGLLSNVFGEHMVLQAGAPIEVWGFAPPNAVVTVSLRGVNNATAVSSPGGTWRVTLGAEAAGGPFSLSASSSDGEATNFVDVFVGTVILCSGQSNLSGDTTPVSYAFNATETIAEAASFPFVRVFKVGELGTPGAVPPLAQLAFPPKIPWSVAAPASVASFSATCWMAAKELARTLGPAQPLGLIESAWSGTCVQAWISADALPACGAPPPAQPPMNANSTLFNQMIAPFGGFAVAGVIWYQVRVARRSHRPHARAFLTPHLPLHPLSRGKGESNAIFDNPAQDDYSCALPLLISSWRSFFRSPDGWFGIVQLAPWAGSAGRNNITAQTRDDERAIADADTRVTIATAADLGDAAAPKTSIHPRPKQEVGRRLARGALLHLFGIGSETDSMGPRYAGAAAGGGPAGALSATISFRAPFDSAGALALRAFAPWPGVANASECPPSVDAALCAGFALEDAVTGAWYAADAALSADESALVLVAPTAPAGATLGGTSSGWGLWPLTSLYGVAGGMPAYPWRH
jgi:hypothetical protein